MMKVCSFAILIAFISATAFAQCGMPGMGQPQPPAQPPQQQAAQPKPQPKKDQMSGQDHQNMPGMKMEQQAGPTEELGSGTMPQPASSPAYMWMTETGGWDIMTHGVLFLAYDQQGSPRGRGGKAESVNWLMFMERRKLGKGTLAFREMFSAEALTAPHGGFPELFQTGETYRGVPIVDAQHPHDLVGELSLTYTLPLNEHVAWQFYGGVVGEPALGPVAFVHRISAAELPLAPLGHHLEDSTHISPGVVTTGFLLGKFKLEASAFNGREPDQDRATIDFAPMDSWSTRLSFQPARDWTMQYSFGHLVQPEALEPTNIDRQTASVTYNRPLAQGNWATSLIWGRNAKLAEGTVQNGYMLESTLNFRAKNYVFTRLELVDKDELFPTLPPLPQFRIGAYTFGGVRDVVHNDKLQLGLGADVTFYSKPAALDPFYGSDPVSFQVFVRIRPGLMQHH
jgi:hypothetical protein